LPDNRDCSTVVKDLSLEPRAQYHSDRDFRVAVATMTNVSWTVLEAGTNPAPIGAWICHAASFIVNCVDFRCGYCVECAVANCAIARAS